MEVGAIQSDVSERKEIRSSLRSSTSGRGPSGGGDGRRGPGGSGGGRHADPEPDSINRDKSRVIVWVVLLVVLMTFGGLIGAYIVLATNRALEWQPFNLPIQVWVSTLIILASSVAYELFHRAVSAGDLRSSRRYLVATTVLGAFFIASQLIVWLELVNRGLYMRGNPYAGFFYILTAVHAIHVLGGMVALGAILRRTWYPAVSENENVYRSNVARAVGWYWHLMGGLWLVLFVLLGFWK